MYAKIVLLFSLFLTQAIAAEPPVFRFSRPIILQDDGRQILLAVALDDLIYASSNQDFRDLRITDQDGAETPYLLQKIILSKTVIQRQSSPSEIQTLQKTDDDGIVVTVSLDNDAANADGLTVVTAQHDFEYHLQIHGSIDGTTWKLLVENAIIYDYSRFMTIGNLEIPLPSNNYRHFKIVVAEATQTRAAELMELTRTMQSGEEQQRSEKLDLHIEPLHMQRIDFWHNQTETLPDSEQKYDYPVTAFNISQGAQKKISLIEINTQRQPLTGFKLKIDTPTFNRQAEVQIPQKHGIETRMQTIGKIMLKALHFKDINQEQTGISFPEQRQSLYRIIIHNQDNPPLKFIGVNGIGNGYQLLFLTQPGKSYQLHYGADKAEAAHYDTEPIRELLRRGYQSTAAALGPETASASVAEKLDLTDLLNSKLFLGMAIGLMVLVLVWSLYKVGKRAGELS